MTGKRLQCCETFTVERLLHWSKLIKLPPQKRGLYAMALSFCLSCSFVCRLKRVLDGHWLTWAAGTLISQPVPDILMVAGTYRIGHSGRTGLLISEHIWPKSHHTANKCSKLLLSGDTWRIRARYLLCLITNVMLTKGCRSNDFDNTFC